jgi:hypothetical protein
MPGKGEGDAEASPAAGHHADGHRNHCWVGGWVVPAFATDASNGVSTNANVVMEAKEWAVLAGVVVKNPPGKTRYCTAVGSADVVNPGNCGDPVPVPLLYLFTLTLDDLDPAIDGG